MRKDVRFGLTIAGSLLAIVVIWAALFTHNTLPQTPELALAPATQPAVDLTQTSTPTGAPTPAAQSPTADASTQPSTVADSSGSRDWTTLLETGGSTGAPTTQPLVTPAMFTTSSATATSGATTRPTLATARTHKVAPGETFSTIAAAVYGDSKYYMRLEDANPTVNPNRLRVNSVINIPSLNESVAVKASASSSPTPVPVDASKSYKVLPSDTLMAIARKLYGNGQDWEEIYSINRDVIGANPARLQVGMVLRLPQPPTVASAN